MDQLLPHQLQGLLPQRGCNMCMKTSNFALTDETSQINKDWSSCHESTFRHISLPSFPKRVSALLLPPPSIRAALRFSTSATTRREDFLLFRLPPGPWRSQLCTAPRFLPVPSPWRLQLPLLIPSSHFLHAGVAGGDCFFGFRGETAGNLPTKISAPRGPGWLGGFLAAPPAQQSHARGAAHTGSLPAVVDLKLLRAEAVWKQSH